MTRDVTRVENAGAVNTQARLCAAFRPRHDHLEIARLPRQHAPQRRGREMAEHRPLAAGQDGGHEVAVERRCLVADGVDRAVHAVKLAALHPPSDRLVTQPTSLQLLERDPPVLFGRDSSDVRIGAWPAHRGGAIWRPTGTINRHTLVQVWPAHRGWCDLAPR